MLHNKTNAIYPGPHLSSAPKRLQRASTHHDSVATKVLLLDVVLAVTTDPVLVNVSPVQAVLIHVSVAPAGRGMNSLVHLLFPA